MNRAVAAVYARSIGVARPLSDEAKDALIDCIMPLVEEVNRMEKILSDPFIQGYLEARKSWGATVPTSPTDSPGPESTTPASPST